MDVLRGPPSIGDSAYDRKPVGTKEGLSALVCTVEGALLFEDLTTIVMVIITKIDGKSLTIGTRSVSGSENTCHI